MPAKPSYSHADYKAFWWKDFIMEWQSCKKLVGQVWEGSKLSDEEVKSKAEFFLKLTFPMGLASKFNCGDTHCPSCNPDAVPFN